MSQIAIINFLSTNATVIDLQNCVTLGSYKNSSAKRHNATLMKNELLLLGDSAKSLMHVFHLKKWEEDLACKVVLSAKPTAIAASYDGCFVAIATGADVTVWQPSTNLFVKCPKTHYQQITCVRFTRCGSYFITAGDDGMIVVWHLTKVLSTCEQTHKTCAHVFSDHQLPVTDIFVSNEINATYLLSTSMDRTCRIYDLNSQQTVLKIVFESVMCVGIFSDTKSCAYLGDTNGNIYKVILNNFRCPTNELFENQMTKDLQKFASVHKREITSLAMTICNMKIISGSLDKQVVIWNSEGQALKVLPQTSEVTNISVTFASCLKNATEGLLEIMRSTNRIKCSLDDPDMQMHVEKQTGDFDWFIGNLGDVTPTTKANDEAEKLREENARLKSENAKLFEHIKMLIESKKE